MGRSNTQISELRDFTRAVDAVGTAEFFPEILGAIGRQLGSDARGLVHYSRRSLPHYLVTENISDDDTDLYLSGFYRFDPFLRYWRENQRGSVETLTRLCRDYKPNSVENLDYVNSFHTKIGMVDELGIMCPKLGGAVDDFFFLREATYRADELDQIRSVYPLITALHHANQKLMLMLIANGSLIESPVGESNTFLIVNGEGREVIASPNWHAMIGGDVDLSDAFELIKHDKDQAQVTVPNGAIRSENLGPSFIPEPGGRIFFLVQRPPAHSSLDLEDTIFDVFGDRLTNRELSICKLILRGFPSIEIAKRLGISHGTIKNHRKRIYRKLDITTERELFLILLNQIVAIE